MRIEEVPLERRFIDLFRSEGITDLYPPQELLVSQGLEGGGNIVLSTPTASGKTIASEIAFCRVLEAGRKVLYVVPLRSLAYEKYVEFRKYESLGFKVRLEMGDLDSSKYRRLDYDILVTTAEKCDSILRSRPEFFNATGILVVDEVHLINSDRGPVYEILISKFQRMLPDLKVLALSATIGNAAEVADWLNAKLLSSDWRPVELEESVAVGQDKYSVLKSTVRGSLAKGGQCLVFVNSRRSSEAVAEKLSKDAGITAGLERDKLQELSEEILSALGNPTQQCMRLASCVKGGTAFHHAGLVNSQRILVEDSFKKGLIKVITATPTLAAGVNLPARTVVIRDLARFDGGGLTPISVMEYKQQAGRAGRPKFDTSGHAVLIASSDSEAEYFTERYIHGEVEDINSRLGIEPVLRFHVLAAIASDFTRTKDALMDFFRSTFFGFQYGLTGFESLIDKIIGSLETWGFIRRVDRFLTPTPLGSRVSELYIDPRTAYTYITLLRGAEDAGRFPVLGLLEMLCDSVELPLARLSRSEESAMWEVAYTSADKLYRDLDGFDLDANFLERFKTALLLHAWIDEISEQKILEEYRVAPGILNQKIQVAKWLSYSAAELSKILEMKKAEKELRKLETRIDYGVKEELIPLVSIRGIGRVRARKLYQAGIRNPADLKATDLARLKSLVGEKTAENIKSVVE